MLTLVMSPGLPEERSFALPVGSVTIGRTKDNDITCVHKSLSRRHAKIEYDGSRVRVSDLQSKNGLFHKGTRVAHCDLLEGDSFRCGDITFVIEGSTARSPKLASFAQTLPSPLARESVSRTPPPIPDSVEDDQRQNERLFLLIRASELLVSRLAAEHILDELVELAALVPELDRVALLTVEKSGHGLRAHVKKAISRKNQSGLTLQSHAYSRRVVDWVLEHGAASFADVSRDRSLPGDLAEDRNVRSAICAPIDPGDGILGVLYADTLMKPDAFRADDLALLRALANLAAVAFGVQAPGPTPRSR